MCVNFCTLTECEKHARLSVSDDLQDFQPAVVSVTVVCMFLSCAVTIMCMFPSCAVTAVCMFLSCAVNVAVRSQAVSELTLHSVHVVDADVFLRQVLTHILHT